MMSLGGISLGRVQMTLNSIWNNAGYKKNQEMLIENTSDQEFAFPWRLQMYQEAMIIQGWVDGMRG